MDKAICTLKVGTSALTNENGGLNTEVMGEICRQITELGKSYNMMLVSSGRCSTRTDI